MEEANYNEFTRRIQFSGKSSYTISLPMSWVKELGLSAGAEVIISKLADGSLLVYPRINQSATKRTEVWCELPNDSRPGSIARRLISLYLSGHSIIHIVTKERRRLPSSYRNVIKEVARKNLIGVEVISDSADMITLQVLLSFPELSVQSALKRMFLLAAEMHRDAVTSLGELDKDLADGVIRSDDEVDRFNLYVIRLLNMAAQNSSVLKQIGLETINECMGYRMVVKSVERVADHATGIAESVLNMQSGVKKQFFEKVTRLSEDSLTIFEESGLALIKGDYLAADSIVEKVGNVVEGEKRLIAEIENDGIESAQDLRIICEHIRRTAEYAGDIAEATIDMSAFRLSVSK